MRSLMLRAATERVSSALPKAFMKLRSGYISLNRSLLMMSRASTYFCISSAPLRALIIFFLPSKRNGMVTIPMVSTPFSCAMRATTGAAPVPVPPPIPAVINTILVSSSKRAAISLSLSSAASLASSGLLPAPSPKVVLGPMSTLVGTCELFNACLSVFITTNDTPLMFCSYMWLTALLPPPPIPITFIMLGMLSGFSFWWNPGFSSIPLKMSCCSALCT